MVSSQSASLAIAAVAGLGLAAASTMVARGQMFGKIYQARPRHKGQFVAALRACRAEGGRMKPTRSIKATRVIPLLIGGLVCGAGFFRTGHPIYGAIFAAFTMGVSVATELIALENKQGKE